MGKKTKKFSSTPNKMEEKKNNQNKPVSESKKVDVKEDEKNTSSQVSTEVESKADETILQTIKKAFRSGKNYAMTNILFITFIITSLINAMLVRHFTVGGFLDIKPMMADLVVILVIGAFAYFFKPANRIFYFLGASIFFMAICIINAVYFKNYLSFVSISFLTTATQLKGYTDAVGNLLQARDFIYLWQFFALLFVHFQLRRKGYYDKVQSIEFPKIRFLNTIVLTLVILGFFISMLTSTDIGRLKKQWNREYVVLEFGIYVYQLNDFASCVQTQLNSMFGYDEAAKNFREFYQDVPEEPQSTNEFTNIFKDKNVIVIHAESIQNFLISDDNYAGAPASFHGLEVTPNLNRLAREGLYFSNFYAQDSVGTSSDTEFTFNSSLLPSATGTVFMNYYNRDYVTTPKMLKELGYYTFSMHGNKGSAWNRSVVHPYLGYDHFYYYNSAYDIDEEIGLGLSDKSFFRQSTEIIKGIAAEHEKWYGLLIMLTNHTPFQDINNYSEKTGWVYDVTMDYEEINEETGEVEQKVADYMQGTKLGNYFKSAHYADEAIGEFIEELDEAGLLENTVVVIYGDHDNKIKRSDFNRYYNYDPHTGKVKSSDDETYIPMGEYEYELNRSVPFIIWTKDMAGTKYNREVTTVMGMIDCQPTLGNMFGFYNKYALGHDIFSVDDNIVVFPTGNWLTNDVYYDTAKETPISLRGNSGISLEERARYSEYADKLISISNGIITHDLIKRVGENPDNELLEENNIGEDS